MVLLFIQDQRAHFQERPPWNEPEHDRRFKEPHSGERWDQNEPFGSRRHDEHRRDINQDRDNSGKRDRPYRDDVEPFRPDDWRQPYRPPFGERGPPPPRDQAFDLPADDRRQPRPPFDARQEGQQAAGFAPDQGPPGHFQGGYPPDRHPPPPANQVCNTIKDNHNLNNRVFHNRYCAHRLQI